MSAAGGGASPSAGVTEPALGGTRNALVAATVTCCSPRSCAAQVEWVAAAMAALRSCVRRLGYEAEPAMPPRLSPAETVKLPQHLAQHLVQAGGAAEVGFVTWVQRPQLRVPGIACSCGLWL